MQENRISPDETRATQLIMLLSAFVAMLNETSITVALTDLMRVFGVGVSTVQWLVTGFMLVTAIVVPVTAYIIQRFHDRTIYFTSLGLLVAGALLCGFAPGFGALLAGRLVQAAGTCCVWALTMNTMLSLSTDGNRGSALGLIGLVSIFAPAIAPAISGVVLQAFGWRWIFLGMVPLFLGLGVYASFRLRDTTPTSGQSLDLPSAGLVTLAFGCLIYGASGIGAGRGAITIGALAIGAFMLALLVLRQLRLEEPLLDLRLFKKPVFPGSMLVVFFCNLTMMGAIVLMPLLYVQGFGLSPALAGLCVMPACLINGLASPLVGRLCDRFGPRTPARIGTVAMIASALALGLLPKAAPLALFILVHCLILVAITTAQTASQAMGMGRVPPRAIPHGTAIMSTLIQLGGGFGSAVYAAIFARGLSMEGPGLERAQLVLGGFHTAFLVGAAILVIPLVVTFLAPPPRTVTVGDGAMATEPAD